MRKYIDAEKLITEIERLRAAPVPKHDQQCDFYDGYSWGLNDIENLIDSLQQKQQEVDLDTDIKMEWDSFNKHIAKYSEGVEVVVWLNWFSFVDIANCFYKLGLNAKEE